MVIGWTIRLWGSLSEPRTVTAVMVGNYVVCLGSVVWILADQRPDHSAVILGGAIAAIGCVLGAPSAWRGSWWLEGVSAGAVVVGLTIIGVMDLAKALPTTQMPGYPLGLTIALAGFFLQRAMRIWPHNYRPDREPVSEVLRVQAKARAYREIAEADTEASARGSA